MMLRSRRLNRYLPSLVAGAVAVALLMQVLIQLDDSSGPVATPIPQIPGGTAAIPPAQAMATVSLDPAKESVVVDRPLFSSTRRPPPPAPPPAAEATAATKPSTPQAPPINFTLVGIVRDGRSKLAIIQPSGGKVLSLHEGQTLDGWTLVSIGVARASFRNGTVQQELALDFKRAPPPPPDANP